MSERRSAAHQFELWVYDGQTRVYRRADSVITRRSVLLAGGIGLLVAHLPSCGYVQGKNILIEERSAEGHAERLIELARELAASKVDVIGASAVAASSAARQATHTVPIVRVDAGDPIGAGLIVSLARPGGNVTGTTNLSYGGKQVELIRELVPRAVKVEQFEQLGVPEMGNIG